MKILVVGAGGMMGHRLLQLLSSQHEVTGTVRPSVGYFARFDGLDTSRLIGGMDVNNFDGMIEVISRVRPHFIVNCVGIIKQLEASTDPLISIRINSYFPHKLANLCRACGIRMIHISTDCVFSGRKGAYTETDISDAEDLYGRSKFLGEVSGENCLTLRTSIIGRELQTSFGLVDWFLRQSQECVQGYRQAIYTGLTTTELARVIQSVVEKRPELTGVYQVSSDPINKYDLLCMLRDTFGRPMEISPVDEPKIDRSLDSTRFRKEMGYSPPAWSRMIEEMAQERAAYDRKP